MHTLTPDAHSHTHAHPAPRIDASMWIYLWDLVDEGYDEVLPYLRERGLTSLSLACAYHAGKFLAPHNPKRKVVFPEDGTLYCYPDASHFKVIAPAVNSLVSRGHHFASVAKHAERYGMEARAWVVCCHNSRIGTAYPSTACVTAFGDRLPHNLCPNNRDVRDYLRGLLLSLAAQGARTIELEALQFQGYLHGSHHEREGIPLPPLIRSLLGLCFCESCRREAPASCVDIDGVREWARRTLELYFADPSVFEGSAAPLPVPPGDLFTHFERWREGVIASLAGELADAVSPFHVQLRPMASVDPAARANAGVDIRAVAEHTGGMLMLAYIRDGEALRAPLADARRQLGTNAMTVGLHVGMPESGWKNDFLERAAVARSLGITSFNFYNYGFMPRAYIDWIPEAIA